MRLNEGPCLSVWDGCHRTSWKASRCNKIRRHRDLHCFLVNVCKNFSPFISPFCDHSPRLHLPRFLLSSMDIVYIPTLSHLARYFSCVKLNRIVTQDWNRYKSSLAMRSNRCKLCALEALKTKKKWLLPIMNLCVQYNKCEQYL